MLDGRVMTYGELDARANRLARYLEHVGVEPGDLVGAMFDRSFDLIVAMLAILKAGAAYLPLDLSYPPERLRLMLVDAQPSLLLSELPLLEQLPRLGCPLLSLSACAAALPAPAAGAPSPGPHSPGLAVRGWRMKLENCLNAVSSVLQAVRPRLEPVTRGPRNAAVWNSGAWGSILDRMRRPTRPADGSAKRRRGADEALEPAPPSPAVPAA